MCTSGATVGIRAFYVAAGGGGGGITTLVAGPGISIANPSGPTATITATGTPVRTVFNVLSYGATGDGSTDDTAAINSAIAAVNSYGSGALYFPAGTYVVSSGNLSSITVPAKVYGDGVDVSTIASYGYNGLKFDYSAGSAHVCATVRDLKFHMVSASTNTGIEYIAPPNSSDLNLSLIFDSLSFVGGWNKGIYVHGNTGGNDVQSGYISNIVFFGNPGVPTQMDKAIHLLNVTGIYCDKCWMFWCNYGFWVGGDSEGNVLTNSAMAAINYGVWFDGGPTLSSGNTVDNVQITGCNTQILMIGGTYANGGETIIRNLWGVGNQNGTKFININNASSEVSISGCKGQLGGGGNRFATGIVLGAGVNNVFISDCSIFNVTGAAVDLSAGTYNTADDIRFNDCLAATALVGTGTGNWIRNSVGLGSNVDTSWTPGHY